VLSWQPKGAEPCVTPNLSISDRGHGKKGCVSCTLPVILGGLTMLLSLYLFVFNIFSTKGLSKGLSVRLL